MGTLNGAAHGIRNNSYRDAARNDDILIEITLGRRRDKQKEKTNADLIIENNVAKGIVTKEDEKIIR